MLQQVVQGDLVLAGNSIRPGADGSEQSDVDDDTSVRCVRRTRWWGTACADNSSAAFVDLPPDADVVAARLYVTTSVAPSVGSLRVRLAGPNDGGDERSLDAGSTGHVAQLHQGAHRQAVWDVTDFVGDGGAGYYTVADVISEATSDAPAYAAWSIVVAYQLDEEVDLAALAPELQTRFARRAISWHDGLATTTTAVVPGRVDLEVGGFTVPMDRPVFAKSLHIVTPSAAGFDNVLFDGGPLGNNATPGDAAPPAGVVVGVDPACNSTVDLVNGSICTLGTSAVRPAAATPAEPATPVTAPVSTVDMDVVRIPDRYLRPGATTAVVSVLAEQGAAVGVLAVSIDQPLEPPAVTP